MNLKEKIRIVADFPRPGIRFLDITTLFRDAEAFKELIDRIKEKLAGQEIDVIVGPEARGFVLGASLAYALGAGFVPARKPNKLPAETVHHDYIYPGASQAGMALEIHKDAIAPGQKVVIVDDLLATGSTALATCKLVEAMQGEVAAVVFAMEQTIFNGIENLKDYNVYTVVKF